MPPQPLSRQAGIVSTRQPRPHCCDRMSASSTNPDQPDEPESGAPPACVLSFNACDPTGAGGLAADISTMASAGAHALPVMTGAYVCDTREVQDFHELSDDAIGEQARAVLEDMPVQMFKVGFAGSPEALGVIAGIASDYADVPVIAYMPNLAWWDELRIEAYLSAFEELLLPQTTVLCGNHSTLWRWLLPDWESDRPPSARDIARATAEYGVSYVLVTGIATADQHIENVLASAETVLETRRIERFEASFSGAGDTLSAALAALLASGEDLKSATAEALDYLDHCLHAGFRPGMGRVVPDRLFWAQSPDEDEASDDDPDHAAGDTPEIDNPFNDTRH